MDLSRRDAFHLCSRDSSGDKGQFCFVTQRKLELVAPTLPFVYVSRCNIATSQAFAYSRPTVTQYSLYLKPSKFTTGGKLLLKSTYYRNLQARRTYCQGWLYGTVRLNFRKEVQYAFFVMVRVRYAFFVMVRVRYVGTLFGLKIPDLSHIAPAFCVQRQKTAEADVKCVN